MGNKKQEKSYLEGLGIFLMGIFTILFLRFFPIESEMIIFISVVFIAPSLLGGVLMMVAPKSKQRNKNE